MFNAYSFIKKEIVNIINERNSNEEYGCINTMCTARFRTKGFNSSVAPHFCKTIHTEHIAGCPYALENSRYRRCQDSNFDTFPIEDIINYQGKSVNYVSNPVLTTNNQAHQRTQHIHTQRQLLTFCISNSLKTEYMSPLTVDDIILDARNIKTDGRYKGITGIRFLLGTSVKYNEQECYIEFDVYAPTKTSTVNLHARVYLDISLIKEISRYFFQQNKHFKGHYIAVLSDWKTDEDYKVYCTLNNAKNIIYRL